MTNSHTFALGAEMLTVDLIPPAGALACVIKFTAREGGVVPAGGVRLAHVKLARPLPHATAHGRLGGEIQQTEICELKFRGGTPTAEFSGFGGKHATHPVQHLGSVPGTFPVVINLPLTGVGVTISAGGHAAMSDTEIAPGNNPMELLLGMEPLAGGDGVTTLSPPYGWTFEWDGDAVSWVTASDTAKPAAAPTTSQLLTDLVNAELAKRSNLDPAEVDGLTALLAKLTGGA